MYIQLAENGYGTGYTPPSMYMGARHVSGDTYVRGYRRRGNKVPGHYRHLSEGDENPYVYIPEHLMPGADGGVHVREDFFDDLSDDEWRGLMFQLSPYQIPVEDGTMSEDEFLSSRADRKKAREEKRKNKKDKSAVKLDKKKAKNEIRKARADAKRSGKGADVLSSITDTLGGILGNKIGKKGAEAPEGGEGGGGGKGDDDKDDKKILGMSYPVAGLVGFGVAFLGYQILK